MLCFNQLVRAGIHDCQLRLKAKTPVTADATLASSPLARAKLTPSYNLVPVQKLRETSRNTHAYIQSNMPCFSPLCTVQWRCSFLHTGYDWNYEPEEPMYLAVSSPGSSPACIWPIQSAQRRTLATTEILSYWDDVLRARQVHIRRICLSLPSVARPVWLALVKRASPNPGLKSHCRLGIGQLWARLRNLSW